jgi:hypothetical protein
MAKCHHCRKRKATEVWQLKPCAAPKKTTIKLCAECDALLNEMILRFINFPNVELLMRAYKERHNDSRT